MDTKKIDIANIGLIIVSCALAYVLPFELFLFSYAVLGPLHYLTEITWLKNRSYFTNGKRDWYFLIVPCIILSIIVLLGTYNELPVVKDVYAWCVSLYGDGFLNLSNVMIFVAFFAALAAVLFKDWLYKLLFIAMALAAGLIFQNAPSFLIFFAVFLPTLIHVFIFTGLFMVYGALKSKSSTGIAAAVIFVITGALFFVWKPVFNFYNVTDYAQQAIVMNGRGFVYVNATFINLFKMGRVSMETLFHGPVGLSVGRFIAFAYTYHYLNWFSKTEVIKWHKIPAKWLVAVVVLWVLSIALYAYDYKTGLMALYFLSMLHVFLEFPLNYRSIAGIGHEVGLLAGWTKPAVVKNKPAMANSRKKHT